MKAIKTILTITIACLLLLSSTVVFAAPPYNSYTYNYWGEPVPAPQAYLPSKIIDGKTLGVGHFNNPSDFFVDDNNNVYILDSGNNRIVITDENWNVKKVISEFRHDGKEDTFANPQGIFVTKDGHIYVADTDNGRLVELDSNGQFVREIGPPQSDIIPADLIYRPTKLVLDSALRIYVLAQNMNQGILELDKDGIFRGFVGASRVSVNPIDYFWKLISTREQRARMELFIPTEYNNIYIDQDGFIYVTTSALSEWDIIGAVNSRSQDDRVAPVRRLNLTGTDVLRRLGFHPPVGDVAIPQLGTIRGPSMLVDVNVDDSGMYSVLDRKRGRIFTYDNDGNLLFIFGSLGNQDGTFKSPVALENLNGEILVLDSKLNNINVFTITEYGALVRDAVHLHYIGKYNESAEKWKQVLKYNSNSDLAYIGLGKALLRQDRFEEAMKNFKLGNKRDYYSKAFQYYRKEVVGEKFGTIMTCIFLLIAAIVVIRRVRGKSVKEEVGV